MTKRMNVLKAALDTYGERVVSWNTKGADQAGIPRKLTTKTAVMLSPTVKKGDSPTYEGSIVFAFL